MNGLKFAGIVFALAIFGFGFVFAIPTGPGGPITPLSSSRYSTASAQSTPAIAGNVTEINMNATSITQTWQGFFGNITGKIVLGNSNNQSLYDWNLASPQGQVYAIRTASTPNWASIQCANNTEISTEHTYTGASATAADRINNTFLNGTSFNAFYVGTVQITSGASCYATNMYTNTGSSVANHFSEVVLSDTTNIIYTALLDQDYMGFDGKTHDFEMLVAENGHNGDTATTPYYFYLELQ